LGDQLGETKELCDSSTHEVQETRETIADGVTHVAEVKKMEGEEGELFKLLD